MIEKDFIGNTIQLVKVKYNQRLLRACVAHLGLCAYSTKDKDKFMTKLCFGDGDVFVDLTLLNILAAYNYLYL